MEMGMRENDIKSMEKNKKDSKKLMNVEYKLMEALARVCCEYDGLKSTDLKDLLFWHQISPNEISGKDSNYDRWKEICWVYPLDYLKWTGVDEDQLVGLKKREIHISNTVLKCHQETNGRELEASVHLYTEEKQSALETRIVESRDMNVYNIIPV